MPKYPYLLFASAPIGPIAARALEIAGYKPLAIIDNPKLTTEELILEIEKYLPTFILVVGFGAILKREVLDTVAGQVVNIHPSYLPKYRGPAPVVQALLDGAKETGVTLMEVDTKMDHGNIIAQEKLRLRGDEYADELYRVLTQRGVELFLEFIDDYIEEKADLIPQNHLAATITHFIKKEDGLLNFKKTAAHLERKIRAFQTWPRCWTEVDGKRLIIDKAHVEEKKLRFDLVQPENGKTMTFKEYCAGIRQKPEEVYEKLGIA